MSKEHSGRAYGLSVSNGHGLKAGGLFKVFADNSENPALNFMAEHLDIAYYSTVYNADTPFEVSFKGIEIILSNFRF